MRIAGLHLRYQRRLQMSITSFVLAKLLEAPARTDGINVPLGKNGTEPGLQRAAPMEITEERTFRALAAGQTIQLRKQGIREIASFRGARFAAKNRGRRRTQVSTVGGEKMIPGRFASFGASSRQGQKEAKRPGIIFSPPTVLTCVRRRPRFFA